MITPSKLQPVSPVRPRQHHLTPRQSRAIFGGSSAWQRQRAWQRCRHLRCIGLSSVLEVFLPSWLSREPPVGMVRGVTYATVRLQDLQSQMPTEWRLTLVLPQKVQTYLACWVISIFLTDLRSEAPYLYTIMSAPVSLAIHVSSPHVVAALLRPPPPIIPSSMRIEIDVEGRSLSVRHKCQFLPAVGAVRRIRCGWFDEGIRFLRT